MERELAGVRDPGEIGAIIARWEVFFERISQVIEIKAYGFRPVIFFGDPEGFFVFLRLI